MKHLDPSTGLHRWHVLPPNKSEWQQLFFLREQRELLLVKTHELIIYLKNKEEERFYRRLQLLTRSVIKSITASD